MEWTHLPALRRKKLEPLTGQEAHRLVRQLVAGGAQSDSAIDIIVARGDAGPGAGGDVADGVVASLAVGEPDIGQEVHQIGDPVERDEVILNVLPGGEVAASAAELFGNARQLTHLAGGK